MTVDVYLLSVAFSIIFLAIVLNLIRKRRLKEQYALLWIPVSLLMLFLSLNRNYLEIIAKWLDFKYAPSMLFFFGLVFAFALILHMTVVISRLSEQVVRLTQDFALLRQEVEANNKTPTITKENK